MPEPTCPARRRPPFSLALSANVATTAPGSHGAVR